MRIFLAAICGVVLALGVTGAEAQGSQDANATQARELFLSGVDAFDGGDPDEALRLFLESYEVRASQSVLFNIAVTERRLGRDEAALMHLYDWVRINEGDAGPRLEEAFSAIDQLMPDLATLRLERSPSTATVDVDGEPAHTTENGILVLRPGTYTLRFEADGYEASERQFTAAAGTDETIEVSLEEVTAQAAPLGPQGPAEADDGGGLLFTWVGVGLTVAFGGLAVGSWVAGEAAYQDLIDTCAPGCTADQISTVDTWDTLTTVSLVGVGVFAAATVVVALVELDVFGGSESHAVSVGPTGASYRYRF